MTLYREVGNFSEKWTSGILLRIRMVKSKGLEHDKSLSVKLLVFKKNLFFL